MRLLEARTAANVLLVGLGLLAVFHVFVLSGAAPGDMVWGGTADGLSGRLVVLETVGLTVTLLFALLVAAKAGYIRAAGLRRPARIGMWIVFAFFVVNVLGNLASTSTLEKVVFTPVSVVMALFSLRLASARDVARSQSAR
jgi:hypothetical protein